MLDTLALVALLASPKSLPAQEVSPSIDLSQVERMIAAPDGHSVAWTSSKDGAAALVVVAEHGASKRTLTFSTEEIAAHLEGASVSDLDWSPDSRYLAVEVTNDSGDTGVLLLDTRSGGRLKELAIDDDPSFGMPRWDTKGHALFVAHSNSDDSPNPHVGGLTRYDVDSGISRRLLERYWINTYAISGDVITAVATDLDGPDDVYVDRLIRYDLKTRKSDIVISRRTVEASEKGLKL